MMIENHHGEDANVNIISSKTTTETTSNEDYYKFRPSEGSSAFDELHQVIAAELKEVYAQDNNSENSNRDQSKTPKRNVKRTKSAFKGVFKCGKKFKAQIQTHGVQHYLGLFETEMEAAKAYDTHARSILGVKAKTNFVYDPSEQPLPQSVVPSVLDTTTMQVKANGNVEDASKLQAKRSYVGMKLRRKGGVKGVKPVTANPPSLNPPIPITPPTPPELINPNTSFVPPSFPPSPHQVLPHPAHAGGYSLLHLPLPLAQQVPILFNNLPPGYAPVIHPMRFVPNLPSFHQNQTFSSERIPNNTHELQIDWSKQAYSPLDISASMSSQRPGYLLTPTIPPPIIQNAYPKSPSVNYGTNGGVMERDWRDEVYYWSGKLEYSMQERCLVWRGQWLGSFTGKPSHEEMQSSHNEFCYSSQTIDRARVFLPPSRSSASSSLMINNNSFMKPLSGYYQGYYLIGHEQNGQEKEQYTDQSLYLEFQPAAMTTTIEDDEDDEEVGTHYYDVYGIGYSEFGKFLLKGVFHGSTRQLEVSRQYIAEHDPRYKMDLPQWKRFLTSSTRTNS